MRENNEWLVATIHDIFYRSVGPPNKYRQLVDVLLHLPESKFAKFKN